MIRWDKIGFLIKEFAIGIVDFLNFLFLAVVAWPWACLKDKWDEYDKKNKNK